MSLEKRKTKYPKKFKWRARVWDKNRGFAKCGHWVDSKAEAAAEEEQLKDRLKRGLPLENKTVGELFYEWYGDRTKGDTKLSKKKTCYSVWRLYLKEYLENMPAENLTTERVNEIQNELLGRAKTRRGEGTLMPSTVNKATMTIHWIYEYGIEKGYVLENPVKGTKRVEKEYQGPPYSIWTAKELDYFLSFVEYKKLKYANAFRLLAMTGMRPSECCGLKPDDVDDVFCRITLRRGIDKWGNETGMKTANSHRIISGLNREFLIDLLKGAGEEYIFESSPGKPLRPELLSARFINDLKIINRQTPQNIWIPDAYVDQYLKTYDYNKFCDGCKGRADYLDEQSLQALYNLSMAIHFAQDLHGEIIEDDRYGTSKLMTRAYAGIADRADKPFDPPVLRHAMLYTFRHLFATRSLENGVPIEVVAKTLGDKIQTIDEYYVQQTEKSSNVGHFLEWMDVKGKTFTSLPSSHPAIPERK